MRVTKSIIEKIKINPNIILSFNKEEIDAIFKYLEKKYYNTDNPAISDSVYDLLRDIVKKSNKAIVVNNGAIPDKKKIKLQYWMGSMDKITKQSAIDRFKNKFQGSFTVTDKLDGVSALLILSKNDKFMFTRGNGIYGQDISHMIQYIPNLKNINVSERIVIRGELIIKKTNFKKVEHLGANARNMVSGIVNSKNINKDLIQYVDFIGYTLIEPTVKPSVQYEVMKSSGIEHVFQISDIKNIDESKLSDILIERRKNSMYEIDGIIVTHDSIYKIEDGKNPSYAFAFKNLSLLDTKETTVIDIEWNISKDGYIKPIVLLNPVHLSGVVIKKATGFNAWFIKENKIGPGTIVSITRSGDVIPYIKNVVQSSFAKLPSDIEYVWNDTGKEIMVTKSTDEQKIKELEHFYTKIKIKWLSTGTLKKLYDNGFKTPYDVYSINDEKLSRILGNVMAKKIIIERDITFKDVKCHMLMDASNSFGRGFGEKRLELITKTYPDIQLDYIPSLTELKNITGISDISAKQFVKGLYEYKKFIKKNPFKCTQLTTNNMDVGQKKATTGNLFKDKTILFTGFRNKDLEDNVKQNNGKIASTFTKNVSILVVKDATVENKKTEQARVNGVQIYTQEEFAKYFEK